MTVSEYQATTDAQSITERVVSAVARERGVSETELAPLYDAIEPDALEKIFRSQTEGHVSFRYEGYEITVENDGDVVVEE